MTKFIEGSHFKKGNFYIKIVKVNTHNHGGSILEPNEVIMVEKTTNTSITKHYMIYEWVDIPVSKEEFDLAYNEALKEINDSFNELIKPDLTTTLKNKYNE